MGKGLFLLFTVVPMLELWLFMEVGSLLGIAGTLALILTTGALGAVLARHEGLRVLRSWQGALTEGRLPDDGIVSSLLVLVGGALLITPGILTDVVGFSMLLPPSRRIIAKIIVSVLERRIAMAATSTTSSSMNVDFSQAAEGAFSGASFATPFSNHDVTAHSSSAKNVSADGKDEFIRSGYVEHDDGEVILMPNISPTSSTTSS